MALSWEESYVGQIRTLAGNDRTLIVAGARCVLRDTSGRILLIKRSDNGQWAYPAGTMELGETLAECAIREVREETGLVVAAITPFGIYSRNDNLRANMYGHTYQHITLGCRVDGYSGDLVRVTDETTDAGFFAVDGLPAELARSVRRSIADLAQFELTGQLILA